MDAARCLSFAIPFSVTGLVCDALRNASASPRTTPRPLDGLKTGKWWTPPVQGGTMVDGYQVCGFSSWHCLTDSSGGQVLVSLWALVPAASFLLASTGLFDSKIC